MLQPYPLADRANMQRKQTIMQITIQEMADRICRLSNCAPKWRPAASLSISSSPTPAIQ
jgi:hypothetical protein